MPDERFFYIKPWIEGKKVLDIGVVANDRKNKIEIDKSEDWSHKNIKKHSKECLGIDIDKHGLDYLKNKGYDVFVADAEKFDLNQKFEVIVAGEIIEHLSNFEGFFKSIKKHLEKDGVLIITTPNPFIWFRFKDLMLGKTLSVNPGHTCWFDGVTLKLVLKRFGFKIIDIKYCNLSSGTFKMRMLPRKLKFGTIVIFAILDRK